SRTVLYGVIGLVIVANTINIGADIGAMAAAANLLVPAPLVVLTLLFTVIILVLEIFLNYKVYSGILKWLALALLSYPITVFIIHQDCPAVLKATVVPHLEFNFAFLFIITGVFGTTITPYMFFWEASQEVEEEKAEGIIKNGKPQISREHIKKMRIDNNAGMIISEITTWCILLVGATVLHQGGVKDIKTAADAAKALEPMVHSFPHAGFLAKLIFSIG